MDEYLKMLESEEPSERLEALEKIEEIYEETEDKARVVTKLKEMILDWDDDVRSRVNSVLKLYAKR